MIYLQNTSEEQVIFIPKSIDRRDAWKVLLDVKSTISSDKFSLESWVDYESNLYYPTVIKLPHEVVSGEYEYTLSDDLGVLSTGMMVIGQGKETKEYNNTIEYEQYRES